MPPSPLAGKPAPPEMLIDVARLRAAYASRQPDLGDPTQLVAFGTSGHRGAPEDGAFNEAHILAITQAICEHRAKAGITEPLFVGIDTHAASAPAQDTALEVLAANGVETLIAPADAETGAVARQVYAQSGLAPTDIDAAVIYDAFTSIVLWQLESFDFCRRGEAKDFIKDGALGVNGRLPTNTHGGQLSEAYIHGMNGVNEGVRLIRGTSVNQPKRNEHVLVTGGVGVPTSGMILGRA